MRKQRQTQDALPGLSDLRQTIVDGAAAGPAAEESPRAASAPRLKSIDRRQMLFRTVDVDRLVDEDHAVRAIWAFALRLDLDAFYAPIKAVEGVAGREAWNPLLLVSLWLYAYSRGIGSAREVARRCGRSSRRWGRRPPRRSTGCAERSPNSRTPGSKPRSACVNSGCEGCQRCSAKRSGRA